MKQKIKSVVLSWTTWLVLGGLSVNNLFFENWYGGNAEWNNEWYDYLLALIGGGMFVATTVFPAKTVKFFEKTFKF